MSHARPSRASIKRWMELHVREFVECGEVQCTQLVEAWDLDCADGEATLDHDHEAWAIAVAIAEEYDESLQMPSMRRRPSH